MHQGIRGFLIILIFLAIGNVISWLINNFVPGNVIGMILMFAALQMHIIEEKSVESISKLLTNNMTLMFLPAGVGLMAAYELILSNIVGITLATFLSTIIVLVVVGKIQDKWGKKE